MVFNPPLPHPSKWDEHEFFGHYLHSLFKCFVRTNNNVFLNVAKKKKDKKIFGLSMDGAWNNGKIDQQLLLDCNSQGFLEKSEEGFHKCC